MPTLQLDALAVEWQPQKGLAPIAVLGVPVLRAAPNNDPAMIFPTVGKLVMQLDFSLIR